jgi:hypothetical protein
MPLPGFEDIEGPNDVLEEWVQTYVNDMMDTAQHLHDGDLIAFLNDNDANWQTDGASMQLAGNHWTVKLTNPPNEDIVVATVADGNCGCAAVQAILNRAQYRNGTLDATQAAAATAQTTQAVRQHAQDRMFDDEAEVRQRIFDELDGATSLFETGFGPVLMDTLHERMMEMWGAPTIDKVLQDWNADTNTDVQAPFGMVMNARHSRGAPFITAGESAEFRDDDFLEDLDLTARNLETYERSLYVLQQSGLDDQTLAKYLRATSIDEFWPLAGMGLNSTILQSLAFLWTYVNVAEEYRKAGAAKLFRGLMRMVEDKQTTLADAVTEGFGFVRSADDGRAQIGLIQDLQDGVPFPDQDDDGKGEKRKRGSSGAGGRGGKRGRRDTNATEGEKAEAKRLAEALKLRNEAIKLKSDKTTQEWATDVFGYISDDASDEDGFSSDDEDHRKKSATVKKNRRFSNRYLPALPEKKDKKPDGDGDAFVG